MTLLDEIRIAQRNAGEAAVIAEKYAHRMAMLLECIVMSVPSGTAYWDEAMAALEGYRGEMNAIHEQESPTHIGEPFLRHNAEMTAPSAVDFPVIGLKTGEMK